MDTIRGYTTPVIRNYRDLDMHVGHVLLSGKDGVPTYVMLYNEAMGSGAVSHASTGGHTHRWKRAVYVLQGADTLEGSAIFGAQWRTREAKIIEVPAIPDAMPEFTTTYDIDPHAGDGGFDDSAWPIILPTELAAKRGGGKVSFLWFRTRLTIPSRIGTFDPAGAKVVLALCIDDYAEIWVNGELPRAAGRPSPATIQGFNMPQRLVLSDAVAPGDTFHIAVFGINGPISAAPANTVWFREAGVEFF